MTHTNDVYKEAENLLGKAGVISFKYENELFDSQNAFNIFSILRNEHEEVKLHSRFIAELLNPSGCHHLKDMFLRLFLEKCKISTFGLSDDHGSIGVDVERSDEKGGRIDIFIDDRDRKKAVVIENKIYAADQPEQLKRYYEYAIKKYGKDNISILYLTLYGEEPSDDSRGDVPDGVINCVSYENEIDEWISGCIRACALKPVLRETLNQYRNLLRKLTGRSMSDNYISDLKELLKDNRDYIYLADDMSQALVEVKIDVQLEFWKTLHKEIERRGHTIHSFRRYSEDLIRKFYGSSKVTPFGISILLGETRSVSGNYDLVFHIGIEGRELFVGAALCDKDLMQANICRNEEYDYVWDKLYETDSVILRNDWWIGWKYFKSKDAVIHIGKRDEDKLLKLDDINSYMPGLIDEVAPLIAVAKESVKMVNESRQGQ